MHRITSRQNALVSRYRQVARGDDRTALFLDGPHLLTDALAAGVPVQHLLVASDVLARDDVRALVSAAKQHGADVAEASRSVLDAISPVRSPTGVVAIGSRPQWPIEQLFVPTPALILVAHGVQDPGNLGAIARAAEAAGATGLVTTGIGADPYGWKALRGAMGSTFRLPTAHVDRLHDFMGAARTRGCHVVAAVPRGGREPDDVNLRDAVAVVIGGEGAGVTPEAAAAADTLVTIPMAPPVESLNAAVAAALITYEARRQRRSADLDHLNG